jgi:hypothetical protein
LYNSIPADQDYLDLCVHKDGERCFSDLYSEAIDLIRRNFFAMTAGTMVAANYPIQGMKCSRSKIYYEYCQKARARA